MPNNGSRKSTDFVRHFFQFCYMKTNFFLMVIMPFKYTDGKENSLYAWRAFSHGKKIEIFC